MKTITVRDVRQRWPEAERSLAVEGEIVITRDGKPVARLLPMEAEVDNRPRFDPEENRKWRKKTWGDHSGIDTLPLLQADREERNML